MRKILSALVAFLLSISCALCVLPASAEEEILSADKEYTVEYATAIDHAFPAKVYEQEDRLTDGVLASDDPYDGAWLNLYRGTEVSVTIDLGEVMAVDRVTVGQLQKYQWGIYCSREFVLAVSENGEDFGTVATLSDYVSCTQQISKRLEFEVKADKSYKARYVRLTFSSDVNLAADEITVYGSRDASSAASASPDAKTEDIGFASAIDGISSICLMYTAANYDINSILPYVAYVDKQGELLGQKMFDSLLFLAMPVTSYEDGKMRPNDMEAFLDGALSPGKNIGALNTVIGNLKEAGIYEEDEKYPIFISMPFPAVYAGCDTLEARKTVIKNFVDSVGKKFADANYQNLELKGMYWFAESVSYSLTDYEEELIKYFNEYCHSLDYKTIWIPYYCAAGIDKAVEFGFDAATLQSGYAFGNGGETGVAVLGTCSDCAAAAKKYGLGLEFEVDISKDKYYEKFSDYVHVAYNEGLMDGGIMMMYQSGLGLYYSAVGNADRKLYELTYKYCSKEYTEYAPVVGGDVEITLKAEAFAIERFEVKDEDTGVTKLKAIYLEKPENGPYLIIEGDGFISVETYGTAPGVYKYLVVMTDGTNESEPFNVTVTVEPAEGASEASEEGESSGAKDFGKIILYIVIAIALITVIAVVAVIIIKRKKNK